MICPHCDNQVVILGFLIICSYCRKAWLHYEYEMDWERRIEIENLQGV